MLYELYIEPVDEGTEQTLKLRLSTTLGEVKLPVYSNDTIAIAKKKLQVWITLIRYLIECPYEDNCLCDNNNECIVYRVKRVWSLRVKGGSLVANCLVIKCI